MIDICLVKPGWIMCSTTEQITPMCHLVCRHIIIILTKLSQYWKHKLCVLFHLWWQCFDHLLNCSNGFWLYCTVYTLQASVALRVWSRFRCLCFSLEPNLHVRRTHSSTVTVVPLFYSTIQDLPLMCKHNRWPLPSHIALHCVRFGSSPEPSVVSVHTVDLFTVEW